MGMKKAKETVKKLVTELEQESVNELKAFVASAIKVCSCAGNVVSHIKELGFIAKDSLVIAGDLCDKLGAGFTHGSIDGGSGVWIVQRVCRES